MLSETGLIFREETTGGAAEVPVKSDTKIGPPVGCDVLAQVVYTAQVGRSLSLSLCTPSSHFPALEAVKVTNRLLPKAATLISAFEVPPARCRGT